MKRFYCFLATLIVLCSAFSLPLLAHAQNIEYVGSYDSPGDARGICVVGNYAYVADGMTRSPDYRCIQPSHSRTMPEITTLRTMPKIFLSSAPMLTWQMSNPVFKLSTFLTRPIRYIREVTIRQALRWMFLLWVITHLWRIGI